MSLMLTRADATIEKKGQTQTATQIRLELLVGRIRGSETIAFRTAEVLRRPNTTLR